MGSSEKFCLRWNDFESNISVAFREIREEKDFFDVTLSVGDRQLQAHKLILSACSPFFRSVLRKNPHPHPLLYLKGVEFSDLQSVLNFMYHGEVNVAQEELNSFLAVAEDLKVKGLTQNNSSSNPNLSPKINNKPTDGSIKHPSTNRNVAPDIPVNKRSQPSQPAPQYQPEDDDIQEVMPIVKTEPVIEQQQQQQQQPTFQQPTVSTFQQSTVETTPYIAASSGGTLTQMEDQTGYGEDDGYDYGGYEEGYEGMEDVEGAAMGDSNKGALDYSEFLLPTSTGGAECLQCGLSFTLMFNARRHVKTVHMNSPQNCHLCGKWLKNERTYKNHIKSNHPQIVI